MGQITTVNGRPLAAAVAAQQTGGDYTGIPTRAAVEIKNRGSSKASVEQGSSSLRQWETKVRAFQDYFGNNYAAAKGSVTNRRPDCSARRTWEWWRLSNTKKSPKSQEREGGNLPGNPIGTRTFYYSFRHNGEK